VTNESPPDEAIGDLSLVNDLARLSLDVCEPNPPPPLNFAPMENEVSLILLWDAPDPTPIREQDGESMVPICACTWAVLGLNDSFPPLYY